MTDINWPETVPYQPEYEGWSIPRLHEPNLSTPMNAGTTRQRRRVTLDVTLMRMQIKMTAAQLADFLTFYKTTLSNGALRFNMQVFKGASYTSKVCAFDPGEPPQMQKAGFNHTSVSMSLLVESYY